MWFMLLVCVCTDGLGAPPVITVQPTSQYVTLGEPFTLSVTATASSALTYQWRFNSQNIAGETGSSLTYSHIQNSQSGTYDVVVTAGGESITSLPVTITVQSPAVITNPASPITVVKGDPCYIFPSIFGSSPMTYQWSKDGTVLSSQTSSYFYSVADDNTAGTYTLKVTNPAGTTTSGPIVVQVVEPIKITAQPVAKTINGGDSTTLSVTATGPGTLIYKWYRYNGSADNMSGASTSTLTITNATGAENDTYYVNISNEYQYSVSSNAVLVTVKAPPEIITPPQATVNSTVGYSVWLSVDVRGAAPLTYQWRKDGVNIAANATGFSGQTSNYLYFDSTKANAGTYSVVVTNTYGSVTSTDSVVTVSDNPNGPLITGQPSAVSASSGSSAIFSVSAVSQISWSTLRYQWLKSGSSISGANSSSLTLVSVSSADVGDYSVIVTNDFASVTSSPAHLTVASTATAPVIVQQPASQTVNAGSAVSFAVVVSANPSPTYQWRKNGINISGANSSTLTLGSAQIGDAGAYSVVVSNNLGTVTSSNATLSLNGSSRVINLSTRAQVGTGGDVLIAGFIINGTTPKQMLIRAVGPTLAQFSVNGLLANPHIRIADAGGKTIATNDDWGVSANLADLTAAHAITGAFPLMAGGKDAAVLINLDPGAYTAVISGVGDTTGVALAELYELDSTTSNQLTNISSRAYVGTGSAIMISGLIVKGDLPQRFLIRGVGPGLTQFSVAGVLANPKIEVVNAAGTVVAANDDWSVNDSLAETTTVSTALNVFPLANSSKDAAMVVSLNPGAYTVLVKGVNDTTGVALVEAYLVP